MNVLSSILGVLKWSMNAIIITMIVCCTVVARDETHVFYFGDVNKLLFSPIFESKCVPVANSIDITFIPTSSPVWHVMWD